MPIISDITSLDKQAPYASIQLDKEAAKSARSFKPGQIVKVCLVATINALSLRKPDDPDEKGFEGSLSLDLRSMDIELSQKNAIAELLDDDE